jgi:hypothetical protein
MGAMLDNTAANAGMLLPMLSDAPLVMVRIAGAAALKGRACPRPRGGDERRPGAPWSSCVADGARSVAPTVLGRGGFFASPAIMPRRSLMAVREPASGGV